MFWLFKNLLNEYKWAGRNQLLDLLIQSGHNTKRDSEIVEVLHKGRTLKYCVRYVQEENGKKWYLKLDPAGLCWGDTPYEIVVRDNNGVPISSESMRLCLICLLRAPMIPFKPKEAKAKVIYGKGEIARHVHYV